ncbi:chorismate synthase [Bacteroidota bacterium]
MSDRFGSHFTFTSIGGSHDPEMRGIITGLPSGISINKKLITEDLKKRSPLGYPGATERIEEDVIKWSKGIENDSTTGDCIEFTIENKNYHSKDYENLKGVFRPSHADYSYYKKYGHLDSSGKGRASGRETLLRVVAGSLAKQYLYSKGINVLAFVKSIGGIEAHYRIENINVESLKNSTINCPDENAETQILEKIESAKSEGDTLGGIIECIIEGSPAGIGSPIFNKLHAELAQAIMSIPSVKGFELGKGFEASKMKGSEYNDEFILDENSELTTRTNHDGGIQGGISNGNNIIFRAAFKPIPSIKKKQWTIDASGKERLIEIRGRHDVCIVPRACVIVESMAAMVMADQIIGNEL